MRNLQLDAVAVEVIRGFREAGIPSILLKGPSLGQRLYAEGARSYVDCDVIVAPGDLLAAARVLRRLGFRKTISPEDVPDERSLGTEDWVRANVQLELHRTILGVSVEPAALWRALQEHVVTLSLVGADIPVLSDSGLAFHVALHAAYHGERIPKPLSDLERALATFDRESWLQATRLAERLEALPAFASGLRLVPEGRRLADELALPLKRSTQVALHASSAPPGALAIARVFAAGGARERARLIRRELFPPPQFMRVFFPVATRGSGGLALAYLIRLASRSAQLPRGVRIWFRIRGGR